MQQVHRPGARRARRGSRSFQHDAPDAPHASAPQRGDQPARVERVLARTGAAVLACVLAHAAWAQAPSGGPLPLDAAVQATKPYKPEEELHWYWRNGIRFSTDDRAFDFKLGGRIHFDGNWIGNSDELEAASPGSTEDGFEFRRVRLNFEGTLYEDWFFKLQPDFAGGEARLRDAYVGRSGLLGGNVDVRAGQFKEPLGLEAYQSSNYLTFVERALPSEAFAPSRKDGAGANGTLLDEAAQWSLGVFRPGTDDFGLSQEDGGYAVTARLGGTPIWHDKGRRMVHLGASYSFRDQEGARFQTRPEVHMSDRFVDTGTLANDDVALAGLELAGVLGPVHALAEYFQADVDGAGDPTFDGWYAQVGWFLTGEARPFKRATGTWDRVKPTARRGALELAARYSTIDLDDGPILGGQEDNVTIGVNWYANANVRMGLNYVRADIDTPAVDDTLDALLLRVQVDW